MKRFTVVAVALSLLAAVGCDETLNPVAPTVGQVTLVSQISAAAEVPPAGSQGNPAGALEAGATGTLSVTMVPAAAGAYTASFTFSVGNLIKSGVLPAPLDSDSQKPDHIPVHGGGAGYLADLRPVYKQPESDGHDKPDED